MNLALNPVTTRPVGQATRMTYTTAKATGAFFALAQDTFIPSAQRLPRFGMNNYSLNQDDQATLTSVLSGGKGGPTLSAPYVLNDSLKQTLLGAPNNDAYARAFAPALAEAGNFRAFIQGRYSDIANPKAFEAKALTFKLTQNQAIADVQKTLAQAGINTEGQAAFKQWAETTGPAMELMGFADAIPHAGQVARLATLRSAQDGKSPSDILLAAFVGWIHDPKLAGSFENIASHPIVAKPFAQMNTDSAVQEKLQAFIATQGKNAPLSLDGFTQDLNEAVQINNDSKWVLQNIILPGLKRRGVDSPELAEVAQKRFESLANGTTPPAFSPELSTQLAQTPFDTGFVQISREALDTVAAELNAATPVVSDGQLTLTGEELYDQVIRQGQIPAGASAQTLKDALTKAAGITPVTVSALGLFANSEGIDAPSAKSAAQALAIADNSLLSPHKIIATGQDATIIARLTSFINSFEDNIRALPERVQGVSKGLQRDLQASMVTALETLTGKPLQGEALTSGSVEEALSKSRAVVLNPDNWVLPSGINLGQADLSILKQADAPTTAKDTANGLVAQTVKAFKATYDVALENSPSGFGKNA